MFGSFISTGTIIDFSEQGDFIRVGLAMSLIGLGVSFAVDVAETELGKRLGRFVGHEGNQ